jgi:DNA-binding NarL/FixJ family response regulator
MTGDPYVPATVRHRWGAHGIDEVAVDRAVRSGGVPLGSDELAAAIQRLTRAGQSTRLIALQIGCTTRTVTRHRTKATNQEG